MESCHEYDEELALSHTVVPEALEATLSEHPDIRAMLAVSPTLTAVAADVEGLAGVCHAHGIPLIMDDAWGADFTFHPELPPGSMQAGADLAIASFHKSLTGLMQTSIILVQGDRIDRERLQLAFDGFETTSTSALLLASMDAARRAMALHGEEHLGKALGSAGVPAVRSASCPASGCSARCSTVALACSVAMRRRSSSDVTGLGITGYQAADWLYEQRRVGRRRTTSTT